MRRVMIFAAAICLATITQIYSSYGQTTKQKPVLILGEGTETCGSWLQYRSRAPMSFVQEAWVRGFLTGMNAAQSEKNDVGKGSDPAAENLWMDNYCRAHPLDTVYTAAVGLWFTLSNRQ
jgi:hypothetical protein